MNMRYDWKLNKWLTYDKSDFKKKQIKYITLEPELNLLLKKKSQETWLSQSAIMKRALINYFKENN